MIIYRRTIFQEKEEGDYQMNSPLYTYLTDFVRGITSDQIMSQGLPNKCRQCRCTLRSIPHMMSKEVNGKAAGYSSVTCKLYVNVDNRPKEADGSQ